jgi:hypothetical protein
MGLEVATIGLIAQGAGVGLEALGSYQAGKASAGAYRQSAKSARREGREEKRLSNYQVRLIEEAGAQVRGQIEAETGKSGLALTGTPLATLVDTARKVELSAALARRAGTVTYTRWQEQAAALETAAQNAERAGMFGAAGSLFGIGKLL